MSGRVHTPQEREITMFGNARYAHINDELNRRFVEKKALVAVHRGVWGGNIIENTVPSYTIALDAGADIFECDLIRSTDGVLYVFHDGTEWRLLNRTQNIKTMSSTEIDGISCRNSIGEESGVHVERFENVLKRFNTGELFNIDRAWDILPEVAAMLKRYPHAIRQAIIKTPAQADYLKFFSECPEKYMYMPIVYSMAEVERVLSCDGINLVGMELIAYSKEAELYQDENIRYMKDHGLFIWVNTINLGCKPSQVLYGGLDDDTALLVDPGQAWGELFRKGIGILQTDWPMHLGRYRDCYYGLSSEERI